MRARAPSRGTHEQYAVPASAPAVVHSRRALGVYFFLISAALFFLLPLYVMGITSIKPMSEIRLGNIFAFPLEVTFEPWARGLVTRPAPGWSAEDLGRLLEFDPHPHSVADACRSCWVRSTAMRWPTGA